MDVGIPPEPSVPVAEHTELQLRYETLQQEHRSFSIQQETLVSKSETQLEKIDHLEKKNAEMKGLLEKYTAEQQRLNDAYYRVIQEHESCQKFKEQLQDLAHRWKAQLEENMELNSTCTKLRRELKKHVENRAPEKTLPIVEEVQAPVAVEATTMSDLEYSDNESISADLIPYTWTGSDDRNQYEIFLVHAVTKECELKGNGFYINRHIEEAIPQITDSVRQAKLAFGSDQFHAITVLGMHLISTEPAYLFECLEANHTLFFGRKSVLTAFVATLIVGASTSQPYHSVEIIEKASSQTPKEMHNRKRKRNQGNAAGNIMIKRHCAARAGSEVAPSTPSTATSKRKPLKILESKKATSIERAAATMTSTAAEQQTYDLDIPTKDFSFSSK